MLADDLVHDILAEDESRPAMPEFFVPNARDRDQAEEVWQATKAYAHDTQALSTTDRRVFRLDYVHDGKHMEAEVGRPHPYGRAVDWEAFEQSEHEEEVLVILEPEADTGPYLVCTLNRGVHRGMPILVGRGEVYQVTEFDESS